MNLYSLVESLVNWVSVVIILLSVNHFSSFATTSDPRYTLSMIKLSGSYIGRVVDNPVVANLTPSNNYIDSISGIVVHGFLTAVVIAYVFLSLAFLSLAYWILSRHFSSWDLFSYCFVCIGLVGVVFMKINSYIARHLSLNSFRDTSLL